MTRHYVFNGDADGLCALQQLRLAEPGDASLVTGVKRDIELLRRVHVRAGDAVTVLDVSLDSNRDDLLRILHAGATVRYFDHHFAGVIPSDQRLAAHIDESPEVCTSWLVDRYLEGRFRGWAAVAAFGDGLPALGADLAGAAGYSESDVGLLNELGTRLNYNAYGEAVSDLHFDPRAVADVMRPFAEPLDFIRERDLFEALGARFEEDMRHARALVPSLREPGAMIYILPDAPWARRVTGVLANELRQANAEVAIAILSPKSTGGFSVSIRVPPASRHDASEFCRSFATGGGRKLAAGINHLPEDAVPAFATRYARHFATS